MKFFFLLFILGIGSLGAEELLLQRTIDLRSKKVISRGVHPWYVKLGDSPLASDSPIAPNTASQENDIVPFLYAKKNYRPDLQKGWISDIKVPGNILTQKDPQGNLLILDFQKFQEEYKGYLWYRTEIDLSEYDIQNRFGTRNLVLRLGWIGQADAVYWNGEYIGSTGLTKNTPPNSELDDSLLYYNKHRFYDIPADLLDLKGLNTVAIRVYAKYPIKPGLATGRFYLSGREYADRAEYWDDFKKSFVITLTLLLGVFYMFWQFLFRKEEQATIYFSLASFFMSLNTLTQSKVIFSVFESAIVIKKLEYISWIILFHLLLSFLVKFSRLKGSKLRSVLYLLHATGLGFSVFLAFQDRLMLLVQAFEIWLGIVVVATAYLIYVLIIGRRTPSIGTVFFGFLWLGILLLNDILVDSQVKWYPFQIMMKDYAFGGFSMSIAFGIVKNMVESQKLIQKQRQEKERLSRYFSPEVMKSIVMDEIKLGGEEKLIATLFSDIVGFTTFSERHTPSQVVERLNFLFEQLSAVIFNYHATLDKYIGDAIMAFWGAPTQHPLDAYRAIACAVEMQRVMKEITQSLPEDQKTFQLRIGVNYGLSIVGNIGSQKRMDYTVIGDAVNTAARLESNGVPGQVAVSESAFLAAGGDEYIMYDEVREIQLKGKVLPVKVYFVTDVKLRKS